MSFGRYGKVFLKNLLPPPSGQKILTVMRTSNITTMHSVTAYPCSLFGPQNK
jgi:hypothetical protein